MRGGSGVAAERKWFDGGAGGAASGFFRVGAGIAAYQPVCGSKPGIAPFRANAPTPVPGHRGGRPAERGAKIPDVTAGN